MATGFRVDKNVEVAMRDRTVLRGDVWRPDDATSHPALVLRTPYQKERAASSGDSGIWIEQLVSAGYSVVVQDTRGCFASDGVWGGLAPSTWEAEARDTYDTVEWAAGQPWCDGGVGLFGASYAGAVCWLGAMLRPPHLRAMAPMVIGDRDREHLDTGGAFWLHTWISWYLGGLASKLPGMLARGEISEADAARAARLAQDATSIVEYLPLCECPYFDLPGMPITLKELICGDGAGLPESFVVEQISVPTLLIGGWYDLYPARMVEQFQRLRAASGGGDDVRAAHRLIMGPWTHNLGAAEQGEIFFGAEAAGLFGVHPNLLTFFDRHLKGRQRDLPPVRYFLMGANRWSQAAEWPPAAVHTRVWYLAAGGGLSGTAPGRDEPPDHYRYDPADPVRTLGGQVSSTVPGGGVGGPRDQSRIAARDDVLCYVSDVLTEPVDLTGEAVVRLYAASSAVDTDFVAKIVDIYPDGWTIVVNSGLARARYRKGIDQEIPLEPGVVEEYRINLGPVALRLPPGHRLGVYLCSSDFPWLDRNMNTGNLMGVDAAPVIADQTVFHDRTHPSRLEVQAFTGNGDQR